MNKKKKASRKPKAIKIKGLLVKTSIWTDGSGAVDFISIADGTSLSLALSPSGARRLGDFLDQYSKWVMLL